MRSLTKLNLSGDFYNRMSLRALPGGFEELASLEDLSLAYCHALAKNEGTFTILSQIPTLTKLNLANCDMESLPAGIQHPSTAILTSFSDPHPSTLKASESWSTWRSSTFKIAGNCWSYQQTLAVSSR